MESLPLILDGCLRKDQKYQKILYEGYFGFALKIVFRYIYRYDTAVCVANDGFVKFFTKIDQFVPSSIENTEKIMMGYLKKIMVNTSIDELRKTKMTPEIGGIPENLWNIPDNDETAEKKILYKEIIVMIKKLPPNYRAVFNLYVIDGYNHLEIAELLNIPVGTSKSNLSRARLLLQNAIKQIEETACRI